MALEKLANESQCAFNLRCRLVEQHGAVFQPGHKVHFFDKIWKNDGDEQNVVFFLDSLYAALMAEEKKVALRAYIQACEYSAETKFRYLRYHHESAFIEAKNRIEKWLEV